MPDEQLATAAAAEAPAAPAMLAVGRTHAMPGGLELTVLAVEKAPMDDGGANASARVILRVRVHNVGDEPREFENNFGVVDHTGTVHRRVWANPARYPSALAGVAVLAPGAAIEGDAHVLVPGANDIPTAALRAAFLAMVTGCGACEQGVMLYPVVVWQDDS